MNNNRQGVKESQGRKITGCVVGLPKQSTIKAHINIPRKQTVTNITDDRANQAARNQQQRQNQTSSTSAKQNNLSRNGTGPIVLTRQQPISSVTHFQPIIMNAPTSLSNLAQLSGVTLVPLNSAGMIVTNRATNQVQSSQIQARLEPTTTITRLQRDVGHNINDLNEQTHIARSSIATVVHQRAKSNNAKSGGSSSCTSIASGNSRVPVKTETVNRNKPFNQVSDVVSNSSLYNLSTISPFPTQEYHSRSSATKIVNKSNQLEVRSQSRTINKCANRGGSRKQQSNHIIPGTTTSSSGNLQMQSTSTDYTPIILDGSDAELLQSQFGANIDEFLSRSSQQLDLLEDRSMSADTSGDQNNISLIRLMAIMNNPALTITAVNSREATVESSHLNHDPMTAVKAILTSNAVKTQSNKSSRNQKKDILPASISSSQLRANELQASRRTKIDQAPKNSIFKNSDKSAQLNIAFPEPSKDTDERSMKASDIDPNLAHTNSELNLNWLINRVSADTTSSRYDKPEVPDATALPSMAQLNDSSFVEDIDESKVFSTSVRNLIMQQQPVPRNETVSVQLLRHIANQSGGNMHESLDSIENNHSEPEDCIMNVSAPVKQFENDAKRFETEQIVTSERPISLKDIRKPPLQTTKKRLYLPRLNRKSNYSQISEPEKVLSIISIEKGSEKEVHVSEDHSILDTIIRGQEISVRNGSTMPEPDEIFINRSKRIMSKIDMMIERKKRRRFERISSREEPKTSSLEEQYAESEEEWSSDEEKTSKLEHELIHSHLPLKEPETPEKRELLSSVGLVSRRLRNKISVDKEEERSKIFSPLCLGDQARVPPDVSRFVDMMLKTADGDLQMRIETNIKRNDLPLLEGLNRNTSRAKMNFMSFLGLEKRSKRTTLYKMKTVDHSSNMPNSRSMNDDGKCTVSQSLTDKSRLSQIQSTKPIVSDSYSNSFKVVKQQQQQQQQLKHSFVATTCREAIKPPSKDEYMKSLGLMAS